ncbi:Cuticlin-1 [Orchesella cincta]|uniref:Cuticlin-1 n=1 Tax=Orchesella cincta TaxID=48709 RepID=A0A1D2N4Y8_ORCCI|nr:Cuticlin-1 [Orchesella cincta]
MCETTGKDEPQNGDRLADNEITKMHSHFDGGAGTVVKKLFSLLLLLFTAKYANSQSNYGLQALDGSYGEGLPPTAVLAGKVTELDTLKPEIKLNRTAAVLNCASGFMHVELKFKDPFYGLVYADYDRNSACYSAGSGDSVTILEIPLKGCGTRQEPARVFTNNVIVRFHPGLEMEGDEVITVVCRYPPPIVPPVPLPLPLEPPLVILAKPLKEFEVLMIICTIMFLGIMLLGLGCSYYCLKQRNIQVIRKRPFSPMEEESEKLSTIESFSHLKIPRVQPPSASSSEVPLEETLASDYPSSIEDGPQRPDTVSSEYSDTHAAVETEMIPASVIAKPHFEVNLRVAEQPLERSTYYETDGSITSIEEGVARAVHVPELHPPPRRPPRPPVFEQVQQIHIPQRQVQTTEMVDHMTIVDKEEIDTETRYVQPLALRKPEVSVHTVDDVYVQTIVERRLIEDEERKTREITQLYRKDQPRWDVSFRTHPRDEEESWERGSETTEVSSIGWSAVEEAPIQPNYTTLSQESYIRRNQIHREDTDRTTVTRALQKLQQDDTQIWNEKWKVLFRVLESPQPGEEHPFVSEMDYDSRSETASVLTEDDRERWRQIITTESTLRKLLTEATYREDYERIRQDTRFEKLFEPEKWDVIIRTISYPEQQMHDDRLFSDSTSEVSSSVSSSVPLKPSRMYRKKSSDTTATESKSITDVRSMTEMMVDFGVDDHLGRDDDSSVVSSVPGGTARSIADRSSTEIVEFAPLEEDTDSSLGIEPSTSGNNFSRMETRQQLISQNYSQSSGVVQQQQTTSSSSTTNLFTSTSRRNF